MLVLNGVSLCRDSLAMVSPFRVSLRRDSQAGTCCSDSSNAGAVLANFGVTIITRSDRFLSPTKGYDFLLFRKTQQFFKKKKIGIYSLLENKNSP